MKIQETDTKPSRVRNNLWFTQSAVSCEFELITLRVAEIDVVIA